MIKQEILDSATDEEFKRRLQVHGDTYHYDNLKREGFGETFRIFGKITGDWDIDIHVANQRVRCETWGSRQESPDIIYTAPLEQDTPDLNRIVDIFKFKRIIEANVQTQKPGACVTNHHDDFTQYQCQPTEKIIRILITLEDWQPGQSMCFGNSVLSYWEKGQVIYSDYEKIPHSTSNASWNNRSILRVTGVASEETIRMLAFNLGEVSI
jgi:hypothetical protein